MAALDNTKVVLDQAPGQHSFEAMTHPHGVLSSITSEKTVLRTMLIGFSRSVALAVTTLLMFSSTASINAQEVAGGIGGLWLFRPKDSL